MTYEAIKFDVRDQVAIATLNRPEQLNALNQTLRDEVLEVCHEVESDDDIRALIFTGEGRGFCSGADISGGGRRDAAEPPPVRPQTDRLDEFHWVGTQALTVHNVTKPVIAAMNGVAAGAGMSLSLACDLRVGCEHARFKTVFLERNLSPDSGMSIFLPRIIGYSRALDLILTSRDVDAEEAYRLGLLDRLVPHDQLIEASLELAQLILQWPPMAVRAAKRVTQQNLELSLEDGLRNELRGINFARTAPNDGRESRQARVEKRKPVFTGT
jgi:2-(1,2-epoxy-1,2-dihydrophenyl)acetyl-CoA isomerase